MSISWSSSIEHLYMHERVYRSIIRLLKQAPSKCQSDLYLQSYTLCKEHDEKMIFIWTEINKKKTKWYNVDFSDLHIINICNEEKREKDMSIKKNNYWLTDRSIYIYTVRLHDQYKE